MIGDAFTFLVPNFQNIRCSSINIRSTQLARKVEKYLSILFTYSFYILNLIKMR